MFGSCSESSPLSGAYKQPPVHVKLGEKGTLDCVSILHCQLELRHQSHQLFRKGSSNKLSCLDLFRLLELSRSCRTKSS